MVDAGRAVGNMMDAIAAHNAGRRAPVECEPAGPVIRAALARRSKLEAVPAPDAERRLAPNQV
jgi:hypothetical protein